MCLPHLSWEWLSQTSSHIPAGWSASSLACLYQESFQTGPISFSLPITGIRTEKMEPVWFRIYSRPLMWILMNYRGPLLLSGWKNGDNWLPDGIETPEKRGDGRWWRCWWPHCSQSTTWLRCSVLGLLASIRHHHVLVMQPIFFFLHRPKPLFCYLRPLSHNS